MNTLSIAPTRDHRQTTDQHGLFHGQKSPVIGSVRRPGNGSREVICSIATGDCHGCDGEDRIPPSSPPRHRCHRDLGQNQTTPLLLARSTLLMPLPFPPSLPRTVPRTKSIWKIFASDIKGKRRRRRR